jgi:hypothetical protein
VPSSKIGIKRLLIEILIHMLLPYPYLSFHWDMKILGNTVSYSASMILFAFCMIRLYVFVKVLKYWSMFTNDKSQRIFKFFGNKFMYRFLYKANIREYSFIALIIIFVSIIYVYSLIFKIFEHYDPHSRERFSYFWNCLWYLVVTMTTSN